MFRLPTHEPETLTAETWLAGAMAGLPLIHGHAQSNYVRAAKARAALATDGNGTPLSYHGSTELAREVGANARQIRLGTKHLIAAGLLEEVAPRDGRTPATYRLIVPTELEWRRDWQVMQYPLPNYPLTPEQLVLKDKLWEFIHFGNMEPGSHSAQNVFVLHGYAGTGKTTAVVQILNELMDIDDVLFVAPSNKAASVLRELGVQARTVSSAFQRLSGKDENGELKFTPNGANRARDYRVVVVDEASMVNEDLALYIEQESPLVIAVGDPYQLPPVRGAALWTAPGRQPDHVLTQVMRTDNPDLREIAYRTRTQGLTLADIHGQPWRVPPGTKVNVNDYDQIVCYTRDERTIINRAARGTGPPQPGDKIVIHENTPGAKDYTQCSDYFNGQILTIVELIETGVEPKQDKRPAFTYHRLKALDAQGRTRYLAIHDEYLLSQGRRQKQDEQDLEPGVTLADGSPVYAAAYGYAMTVHKAQGSGWESVLVIVPTVKTSHEVMSRWAYTAITRAKGVVHIATLDQVYGVDA